MLIHALIEEFHEFFAQAAHHDTVLWFDPDREYEALLDNLTEVPLWRFDGSVLRLRYHLGRRTAGDQTVVYLPMDQDEADLLRPYFATSLIFKDRLYRFLRRQGLAFPDDPQVAHRLRNLLPQLAARSVGKGRAFWEYNLANLERATNTLLGEFDATLLRFLDGPHKEMDSLRSQQFDGLFSAELAGAYGLKATPDDDPDQTALQLVAQLALIRTYIDAGQPDGFPYQARLPRPHLFERCARFLDRWQNDARYAPAYLRLSTEAGQLYDLNQWLKSLPIDSALALGPAFPQVESSLWNRVRDALAVLEREDDWRSWLASRRAALQARADGFWATHARDPGWNALSQAADLLTLACTICQQLALKTRPGSMLQSYADDWWRIDAAYRTLRLLLAAAPGNLDLIRDRCARTYDRALRAMNERLSTLLEAEGNWPPSDSLPAQDAFWAEQVGPPIKVKRWAVLFVDALRYELGQALLAELDADLAGDTRELGARLAAIPTVTPLGMAALLPDAAQRRVSHDGEWHVHIRDSGDLASKAARVEWLNACLPGCTIAAYGLSDLLRTPTGQIQKTDCTLVFDTTLDAVGENASELAWDVFDPLLRSVKQGVHKLLELGVETVHVVADHGFLLLHEVAEHEKVTVRHKEATIKSRYVVGVGLGSTAQLEFRVPGSDRLEVRIPRGVGCFKTPGRYNYVHGGASLQELVVPCLTIRQQRMGRPVGVRVELPDVIRQAQLHLLLEPLAETVFDQPRRVSLALEKGGSPVVPAFEVTLLPGTPAHLDVWLPPGCGLESGDRAVWVLRDRLTGEELQRRETVSQVDLW